MKRILYVICIFSFLLTFPHRAEATSINGICIGDSRTAGPGNWCDKLSYKMTNVAIAGTTSGYWEPSAASRLSHPLYQFWNFEFPELQEENQYQFATLDLGFNDGYWHVTPQEYFSNILKIAVHLHDSGIDQIFISAQLYGLGSIGQERNPWVEQYNEEITKLVPLLSWIDFGINWNSIEGLNTPDCFREGTEGVHLLPECNDIAVPIYDSRIGSIVGPATVPEPGTAILMALGLISLSFYGKKTTIH